MARRLLVISYHYPPDPTGGHRWALMGRWLRDLGHEVVTIASATYGALPEDEAHGTHRVGDIASFPALRRLLRRPPMSSPEGISSERPLRLLTESVVPDPTLATWLPAAVHAARAHLHEQRFDCVITTGPPHSTHLAGLLLGRRRPAWLADLRDGWRFEPLRGPWPLAVQERLDAALERRVIDGAEAVIGVTRPIAEDIRVRFGVDAAYIPNGCDPDWDGDIADAHVPELDSNAFNIVHTGTLSGPWGRDPRPFLEGLRKARSEVGGERIRLVLAGRVTRAEQVMFSEAGLGSGVRHVGVLSRASALALQRRADALLLLTGNNVSEATGKIYEYLVAGRPIIALAQGNEAERIVTETGTGVTLPGGDIDRIAQAIGSAIDGSLLAGYAPKGIDRYVYPGPAEAVVELVERAIARRATA